ncbi:hypothetical protein AB6A40_000531 [Gnathostoma spinigerum]|uniref:SH3 domain-containing protein n=1 Tax=Gnathostoma spinigerum TaxID=75299 RepID=A0ABD6EBG1_9BILA
MVKKDESAKEMKLLAPFDPSNEKWSTFRERMESCFKACQVLDESWMKACLLSSLTHDTYDMLEAIVLPYRLSDSRVTYSQLVEHMNACLGSTKNILRGIRDFGRCAQKEGQSIRDWVKELQDKVRFCGFHTSKLKGKSIERALRDKLVTDTNNEKVCEALLKEDDPSFETAYNIAVAVEELEDGVTSSYDGETSTSALKKSKSLKKSVDEGKRNNKTILNRQTNSSDVLLRSQFKKRLSSKKPKSSVPSSETPPSDISDYSVGDMVKVLDDLDNDQSWVEVKVIRPPVAKDPYYILERSDGCKLMRNAQQCEIRPVDGSVRSNGSNLSKNAPGAKTNGTNGKHRPSRKRIRPSFRYSPAPSKQ